MAQNGKKSRDLEFRVQGGMARLSCPAEGILKLEYAPRGRWEKALSGIPAPEFRPSAGAGRLRRGRALVELATAGLRLALKLPSLSFQLTDDLGTALLASGPGFGFSPRRGRGDGKDWTEAMGLADRGEDAPLPPPSGVEWRLKAAQPQSWFGLGEKVGPLDKAGQSWEFWNTDAFKHGPVTDPLYKTVPFALASRPLRRGGRSAWGLLLDNPSRSRIDLGRDRPGALAYHCEYGNLAAYFFAGPGPAEVLERYTRLTGRPFLPPLWSLGVHQSRWGYRSGREALALAARFEKLGLPLDCLHLDIDYMRGYRVFTWDGKRFPSPEKTLKKLKAGGVRVTTIIDPGVKADPDYPVFQGGARGGHFVRKARGGDFRADVWPGECSFPDFFQAKTRAWWGDQHRGHLKAGVDGIWNDMNEPALMHGKSMDAALHSTEAGSKAHAEVHNLYGSLMTRATAEGLARLDPGRRRFLLTRAAYAGVQRFSSVWLGDNSSGFEYLRMSLAMLAGMGLSGVPFCGVDVGGFDRDCGAELLARWTQAGCLYPFFRNHSSWHSRRQEPWSFGEPTLSICRRYLRLRHRLLPYLYTLFEQAHRTGAPVLRPMLWEFPQDEDGLLLSDQFMLGPWLLAAPVTQAGERARSLWLPEGDWTDYWTGRRLRGGRHVLTPAPLDTLPLFARQGAVLPGFPPALHADKRDRSTLLLDLYPGGDKPGRFELYEDDGESRGFEKGRFRRTALMLECERGGREIRLALKAAGGGGFQGARTFSLRFHGLVGRPDRVLVDGRPRSLDRDPLGEAVRGLQPGHWQARLEVPAGTREVLVLGAPGLVEAE